MAASYAFPAVDGWFDDSTINNIHKFARAMEGILKENSNQPVNDVFMDEKDSLSYDLYQGDVDYLVQFDVPAGVHKEDIHLTVTPAFQLQVTVSRKRDDSVAHVGYTLLKKYRTMGMFNRTVQLPKDVDVNEVRAKYEGGVLNVVVSKKKGNVGEVKNVVIL